jgi:hypothetical protein
MRPKKGATASTGSQTEEVTWGRRKALRPVVDHRQRKWHEAEERRYGQYWTKDRKWHEAEESRPWRTARIFFFASYIRLMKRLECVDVWRNNDIKIWNRNTDWDISLDTFFLRRKNNEKIIYGDIYYLMWTTFIHSRTDYRTFDSPCMDPNPSQLN